MSNTMSDNRSGSRPDSQALDRLFRVIESRKGGDAGASYTAQLLSAGPEKITAKVREEAEEAITAALAETPQRLTAESADLLYHLLVLWAAKGVTPEDVWAELEAREGRSGIEEKKSRPPE